MQRDTPETRVHATADEPDLSPIDWLNELVTQSPSDAKELLTAYFDDVNNCKLVLDDPKFDLKTIKEVCDTFNLSLHYYYTFDRAYELKTILETTDKENLYNALDNALRMVDDVNLILQSKELLAKRYAEFKQGLFSPLAGDLCLLLLKSKRELALEGPEINEFYIQLLDVFTNVVEGLLQALKNKALEDDLNLEEAIVLTRKDPDDIKVTYSSDIGKHLSRTIDEYPDNKPKTPVSSPTAKSRIEREMAEWNNSLSELVIQGHGKLTEWGNTPSYPDTDKGKEKEKDFPKEKEETPKTTSYRRNHALFPERGQSRSYASPSSYYSLGSAIDALPELVIQGHDKENRIDLTTLSEEEQMEIAIRLSLEEQENLEQRSEDSPSMRRR